MARARNIKPALFKNEILGTCDPLITLLFQSLWCLADREGRLEDRPLRIKAETFAYRDGIDVHAMLSFLVEHDFILRYEVGGAKYIQINKFAQHQTPHHMEVASIIPAPPGSDNQYNFAPISVPLRRSIYARDGHACVMCASTDRIAIDHIIPVSQGGDSSPGNLRTLCLSCKNKDAVSDKKHTKIDQAMSTSTAHADQSALHPTDTLNLIPDSFNLIPDCLNPIPDTGILIPDTGLPKKSMSPPAEPTHEKKLPPAKVSSKGTRLPNDWQLPQAWGEWAITAKPHWSVEQLRKVADTFADHWRAKAGRDACKADWGATWRNWVRSPYNDHGNLALVPSPHPSASGLGVHGLATAANAKAWIAKKRAG